MSCMVLQGESFEALAMSLAAYKVHVPSPVSPWTTIAQPAAWSALAWSASEANAVAYAHRYKEPVAAEPVAHPLQAIHGTLEAFTGWLTAWEGSFVRTARHRSEIGLVKLICCLVYQIGDAPPESAAAAVGAQLDALSQRIALAIVQRMPAYASEPWGDEVAT